MKIQLLLFGFVFFALTLSLSLTGTTASEQLLSPQNLSFQADIYGNSGLETIEYLSDLKFYNFGGFGTNAHVYRAGLQTGDQIAYAVSASNPYAFSIQVTPIDSDPVTIVVTNSDYSQGSVTMPDVNELLFTWDIEQSGLQLRLHRHAILKPNPDLSAQFVIQEVFSVENLGAAFVLNSFSEFLHMDDRTRAEDYDCDGLKETLLAINTYTSNGYPIFGKLYDHQTGRYTQMSISGNFATVETVVNGTLGLEFNNIGQKQIISSANYVTSTAKNADQAEQQIAADIRKLMGGNHFSQRWALRSHNTDDRGGAFVNGKMMVGSRYSTYPDSGWVNVCDHWDNDIDNYVSFASFDLGVCCGAHYGFGIKQDDEVVWSVQGSTSTGLGITYNKVVQISASGVITEFEQIPPSSPLDGDWEVILRTNGGFSFALVDKLPVAGSTNNITQAINITDLLGEQKNHIHFNAWNDGNSSHEWYFAVRKDGIILWEDTLQVNNDQRGLSKYIHLVIDEEGEIVLLPVLDLPFSYLPLNPRSAFMSRTTSVFDHNLPLGSSGNDGNDTVTSYLAITRTSNTRPALYSYDQHNGYDFSGRLIADGQVRAPADGTVTLGYDSDALYPCTLNGETFQTRSCMATIDHGGGWQFRFLHLARIGGTDRNPICHVDDNNQFVQAGDPIYQIGNTGCSTGDHIHMEVLYNNIVVDPSGWLSDEIEDMWAANANGAVSYKIWSFSVPGIRQWEGIDLGNGATLTSSRGTSIEFPASAFSGTWDFTYIDAPVSEPNNALFPTGYSFIFEGVNTSQFLNTPISTSGEFTITVPYRKIDILGIDERSLQLYQWDEELEMWQALPTIVDLMARSVSATVNEFGLFALLGKNSASYQYLPIIIK